MPWGASPCAEEKQRQLCILPGFLLDMHTLLCTWKMHPDAPVAPGRCIQLQNQLSKAQAVWAVATLDLHHTAGWVWGELRGGKLVLPLPWGRAALLSSCHHA